MDSVVVRFFSAIATSNRTTHNISLGSIIDDGLLTLRGYPMNYTVSENLSQMNIKICGPGVFNNQTAKGERGREGEKEEYVPYNYCLPTL